MTEENKTPEVAQEATTEQNNAQPTPEANTSSESTEKDYKELYSNLQAALKKEREDKKKFADVDPDKYHELLKEKAEREEKEKLKKGKYEEIINEYKSKVDEYTPYKEFYEKHLAKQEGVFEGLMSQVPDDQKDFVHMVTKNAANVSERVEIVEKLLPTFKKQDFTSAPTSHSSTDVKNNYEQAKSKGDIFGMISNAKPL